MGRVDDAWAARRRGFEALSSEGRGDRLAVSLGAAARSELRDGRFESALAMMQLEESADRAIANQGVLVDALARQAVLAVAMNDDDAASVKAREAKQSRIRSAMRRCAHARSPMPASRTAPSRCGAIRCVRDNC